MTPEQLKQLRDELSEASPAEAVEACPAAARITIKTDD